MPLTSGRYPATYPFAKALGRAGNTIQGNLTPRSNIEVPINCTDTALAATGVACAVPIPVEIGDVISKVSVVVGATAEATGTNAFAALYSGIAIPALLAQSVTNTGAAALAASAKFDFTLASTVTITQAMAPNGFIYASVMIAAGTIPTVACVATAVGINYQWTSTAPLFLSATHGSGLAATAPATITSQSARATAPVVLLS